MKSPTPEASHTEGVFPIQPSICPVNFSNNISRSGWTWQNLWNLLTINLKNKSSHYSMDWLGHFLQVYMPSWLAKCSDLHSLTYWNMHFWNSPTFGMIWSWMPHLEQPSPPHKFSPKNLSPISYKNIFLEKGLPIHYWGRH